MSTKVFTIVLVVMLASIAAQLLGGFSWGDGLSDGGFW